MKKIRDRKLLCIDGATQITGWATLNLDTAELFDYGQVEKTRDEELDTRKRVIYMIDEIARIIDNNDIDEILMEDVPPAINNSVTVLALGILSGGILGLAHSRNIPISYIKVPTWHSFLNIKKSNGEIKKQSIEWVNNKYNLDLTYISKYSKKNEDNKSDPIAFGYVYLKTVKGLNI